MRALTMQQVCRATRITLSEAAETLRLVVCLCRRRLLVGLQVHVLLSYVQVVGPACELLMLCEHRCCCYCCGCILSQDSGRILFFNSHKRSHVLHCLKQTFAHRNISTRPPPEASSAAAAAAAVTSTVPAN